MRPCSSNSGAAATATGVTGDAATATRRGQQSQPRDGARGGADLLHNSTGLSRGLFSPRRRLRAVHADPLLEGRVGVLDRTVDLALDLRNARHSTIEGDQTQRRHRGRSGQAAGPCPIGVVTVSVVGCSGGRCDDHGGGQRQTGADTQQLLGDSREFPLSSESFGWMCMT